MIKVKRITNENLTLKFNPQGGLSHASFEGQTVTSEIRYMEEMDCKDALRLFGFKAMWDPKLPILFAKLNEALKEHSLALFNVQLLKPNQYGVYLCDSKDPSYIHKTTRAILLYNVEEDRFVQVVRLFDLKNDVCNKLMSGPLLA